MPIGAKPLICKGIGNAQGIDLYSYTGIPGIAKALRALDSYRCRPHVALHCAQMPGNGPKWPAMAPAVPRLYLPIADSPAPALRRPGERLRSGPRSGPYQHLIMQLFKKC